MKKSLLVSLIVVATALVGSSVPGAPGSQSQDRYATSGVGVDGAEPSIAAAPDGTLYISYPGDAGMTFYRSTDEGRTWAAGAIADPDSGDTTVNVDSSGAVYESNLNGSLQGDVYKSLDAGTSWTQKGTTASPGLDDPVLGADSTNSAFFMDRQWVDAYISPGTTTDEARVYIAYHDFVPSIIWVNVSKDGGKTFSNQRSVITDTNAQLNSFCNTIPGGLKVVPSGPHAGRVYVLWLAGSVATNAPTGCNITQMDTFGQIWAAWSDDEGETWANQLVYDAGFGHDASALFADLALDRAGNPYATWAMNTGNLPHTGAEGDQWDVFVSASFDGGKTWNGASDGTGTPSMVTGNVGTHVFPAIAAGDPGRVVVAYIATPAVIPQLPYGKPRPGGVADAKWYVYLARSLDLASGQPTWVTRQLTAKPIHTGDVCTLGLFCLAGEPLGSNRDLLDFIDVVGDPDGMAHVAYADTEANPDHVVVAAANQISGASLLREVLPKLPKLPKPKLPKVLGKKLAATGVGRAPVALSVALLAGAALVARRLRRT